MAQKLADQSLRIDTADINISWITVSNIVTVKHHNKIINDQKTATVSFIVQLLFMQMV